MAEIKELFSSLAKVGNHYVAMNVGVFVLTFAAIFYIVSYMAKHKVLSNLVSSIQNDIREKERLRKEEYEKEFKLEGNFEDKNRLRRIDLKLVSSGLKRKFPELTPELFFVSLGLLSVAVGIITFLATKHSIIIAIAAALATIVAVNVLIEIKIGRNYNRIEEEIMLFINILENMSHSSGNIVEMFATTIPYISEPLKGSVEKCYYEMKSTGNIEMSLKNLIDRTDHKQLKTIFESFRVCAQRGARYDLVVQENKEAVANHIRYRKQKNQIKKNALTYIGIMIVAGAAAVALIAQMVENAYEYIFQTLPGQIIIGSIVVLTLYGFWEVIRSKE